VLKATVDLEQKDASGMRPFDRAIGHLKAGHSHYAVLGGAILAAMNRANETGKPQNQR
jgi:hypothetical protein